jgi:hypothetical protein
LILIALISFLHAIEESGLTRFAFWLPVPFHVDRVTVLHPLLVQAAFATAVAVLCVRLPRYSRAISLSFAVAAVIQAVFTAHSLSPKIADALGISRCGILQNLADCSQTEMQSYYRVDQYRQIAAEIGRPQNTYWVASLDIDPMIAAFNGFQIIDGYVPIYSVEYKHRFEQIIARELDRNKMYSDYFRKWGSRVYLFHSGTPLLIDFCQARQVGAEYILTPSNLGAEEDLKLVGSAGDLKAYEIIKERCRGGGH